MHIRDIMTSGGMKILFVVSCIVAIKFRNVIADSNENLPWFKQNLSASRVQDYLKDYPKDINDFNTYGYTGLMYSVDLGYYDISREFMKVGANLDLKAKNQQTETENERKKGATALHLALLNSNDPNSFKLAKDLIRGVVEDNDGKIKIKKADVQVRNDMGFTPLHTVVSSVEDEAGRKDSVDVRMELINDLMNAAKDKKAYLNAQDNEGNTILHILAQKGAEGLIAELIKKYGRMMELDIENKGIKPGHKTNDDKAPGLTPAQLAKQSGYGYCAYRLGVMLRKYKNGSIGDDEYKDTNYFAINYDDRVIG